MVQRWTGNNMYIYNYLMNYIGSYTRYSIFSIAFLFALNDSLWVKNIFSSFLNDDEELAAIALKSSLADVHDLVTGGYDGAPFSIGDFGFYADNQYEFQAKLLQDKERENLKLNSYLSEIEWKLIDDKLSDIAHHGKSIVYRACRGDSFANLAIRQNVISIDRFLHHTFH